MTFKSVELSRFAGEPVELYRWTQGASIWAHTPADASVSYGGDTYTPQAIRRSGLVVSDEDSSFEIDVDMPRTLAPATQFISGSVPAPLWLTLYRKHLSDAEAIICFVGQVREASFESAGICTLHVVSLREALSRQIPRHGYQPTCNHALYDANCTVNPASFDSTGTVSTISGNIITASLTPSQAAPYFKTGILEFGAYKTMIIDHSGSNLKLLTVPPGLIVTSPITCYAGCDRLHDTCKTKFNNIINFRGFPWVPNRNPFEGVT